MKKAGVLNYEKLASDQMVDEGPAVEQGHESWTAKGKEVEWSGKKMTYGGAADQGGTA